MDPFDVENPYFFQWFSMVCPFFPWVFPFFPWFPDGFSHGCRRRPKAPLGGGSRMVAPGVPTRRHGHTGEPRKLGEFMVIW